MDESLRDQALSHLKEAAELLRKAGSKEDLSRLAYQEELAVAGEELYDSIPCSVCGDSHRLDMQLTRPKDMSFQYAIQMDLVTDYSDWSYWDRTKALWRSFKAYFIDKREVHDFCVPHGDSVRRLKDFVGKL